MCRVRDENLATATATLTVSITDVNDNAPVFTQASYTGSVLEKTSGMYGTNNKRFSPKTILWN